PTLLETLMLKAGSTVPKQTLIDGLFDLDDEPSADAVELYVHRLRKKLETSQATIITLRGIGYLLRTRDDG
ncbi:MAG: winged helix-turn-helix domain-containing protein, partial [Rhodoferax sp.]